MKSSSDVTFVPMAPKIRNDPKISKIQSSNCMGWLVLQASMITFCAQELEELHNQIVAALDKLVTAVSPGTQSAARGRGVLAS